MRCAQLAKNAGPEKSPKIRHLGTIAQLCLAESSQLRHVSTIGEKLVKQQYVLHAHLLTIWRTSAHWRLRSVRESGDSSKFQRLPRLGSVTARHSSSGRQPNFAGRAPPIFRRAAITLGIGPHSSWVKKYTEY